jgi:hypothetical protein
VVNAQYDHRAQVVIDPMNDPVRTAAGGMEPSEFPLQPTYDAMRDLDERGQHDFDDRSGGALWGSAAVAANGTGNRAMTSATET